MNFILIAGIIRHSIDYYIIVQDLRKILIPYKKLYKVNRPWRNR